MTSCDVSSSSTGCPTGRCSSLAVVTIWLGTEASYSTSHHHWCPVTLIFRDCDVDSAANALLVQKSATSNTNNTSPVMTTAATTTLAVRRSVSGVVTGWFCCRG